MSAHGGPAFPAHPGALGDHEGMSLRDHFAAKAMEGFLASTKNGDCDTRMVAQSAYFMADAMLKARAD